MGGSQNKRTVVLQTPWFGVSENAVPQSDEPYYLVESADCALVISRTLDNRFLLVKQYRISQQCETLEFPSGHIEASESAVDAARRELLEETGYEADEIEQLGVIASDTGRLSQKTYCFYASGVRKVREPDYSEIISLVSLDEEGLFLSVSDGELIHGPDHSAILLCLLKGKFSAHVLCNNLTKENQ